MKSFIAPAILLASTAVAAPAAVQKRATAMDATILNYALTLEHLEAAFYAQGLKNYTEADFKKAGFNDGLFYKNLKEIAADEQTHVSFLTSALQGAGAKAAAACNYSFPSTDAASFMAVASILEGVGISAYLGAAASIADKSYLTAAGSILTVESRHNAFIRGSKGMSPFPQPFDTPLDFDQVYSLAAPFITSCPSDNPTLPVKAFPAMTPTGTGLYRQKQKITFQLGKDVNLPSGGVYVAWPLVTGPIYQAATVDTYKKTVTCEVPQTSIGPAGQTFAILTTSKNNITDDNTLAGPAVVPVLVPYLA